MKNLYLLLILFFSIYTLQAQKWEYLNPKPSGVVFGGLCHTDPYTLYIAGGAGTILKSTDAGDTWTNLYPGVTTKLSGICFSDASTVYAVGENKIFKTTDGGISWNGKDVAVNGLTFIDFPDINTGYAIGVQGGLIKTVNGGDTWNLIYNGSFGFVTGLKFTSNSTGYISGYFGNGDEVILKTTDGGNNWLYSWARYGPYAVGVRSLFFLDANIGFAVGTKGLILKTTDAGNNWQTIITIWDIDFSSVCFSDPDNGHITSDAGYLFKSTDGGLTWVVKPLPYPYGLINCSFTDNNTGIFLGYQNFPEGGTGQIYKTLDGGNSLICLTTGCTENINFVSFPEPATGYAVGAQGTIVKTVDAGINWSQLNPGTYSTFYSVSFPSVNKGFIVGESGKILKTSDGGSNWTNTVTGTIQNLHSVSFVDDNTGFVVGDLGTILRTNNGGTLWETLYSGSFLNLYATCFITQTLGYAVGSSGIILRTTDGGNSWTAQNSGISNDLVSVQFVNTNTGYILGVYNSILKTSDGGITWETINPFTNNSITSLYFADENTGYFVGAGGAIYLTLDGGVSWTQELSYSDKKLNGVCITGANRAYAVGDLGTILGRMDVGVGKNIMSDSKNLKVYPNPARNMVMIEVLSVPKKSFLSVFNMFGQELVHEQITDSRTRIDITGFASGVYFVRISNDKMVATEKMVKE